MASTEGLTSLLGEWTMKRTDHKRYRHRGRPQSSEALRCPWGLFSIAWALAAMLLAGCLRPGDEPPDGKIEGQCGLTGEYVECLDDSDCEGKGYDMACDDYGRCSGEDYCVSHQPGDRCNSDPDYFCNEFDECAKPCSSHSDCGQGYCVCGIDVQPLCHQERCPCGDPSLDIPGTLLCKADPYYLVGDCFTLSDSCPEGYGLQDEHACVLLDTAQDRAKSGDSDAGM